MGVKPGLTDPVSIYRMLPEWRWVEKLWDFRREAPDKLLREKFDRLHVDRRAYQGLITVLKPRQWEALREIMEDESACPADVVEALRRIETVAHRLENEER